MIAPQKKSSPRNDIKLNFYFGRHCRPNSVFIPFRRSKQKAVSGSFNSTLNRQTEDTFQNLFQAQDLNS